MIELVFTSDTNQQLAESELASMGVRTERGPHRVLRMDREAFVADMDVVNEVVQGLNGRIEAD